MRSLDVLVWILQRESQESSNDITKHIRMDLEDGPLMTSFGIPNRWSSTSMSL